MHTTTTATTTPAPSKIAAIMLPSHGADDPDQLVGVAAGELFEWAWLAAELADWLDHCTEATRQDFARFFDRPRDPAKTAVFLAQLSERIAELLDGADPADRGQP